MIDVPEPDRSKTAMRTIAEALAQSTPITAGLARVYQFTHPSEFEQQLQQWRKDISNAVNEISQQLRPRLVISETSLEVAQMLVQNAVNGYQDDINFDRIATALPDFDRASLQEACFDLEQLGLISVDRVAGRPVLSVRLNPQLFCTFDPYFLGSDPLADAIEVTRKLLDLENSISANNLEVALGWPRRRFNPAFAIVIERVPPAYLRNPIQPDYPATHVRLSPEVRACLKRFVSNLSPNS